MLSINLTTSVNRNENSISSLPMAQFLSATINKANEIVEMFMKRISNITSVLCMNVITNVNGKENLISSLKMAQFLSTMVNRVNEKV